MWPRRLSSRERIGGFLSRLRTHGKTLGVKRLASSVLFALLLSACSPLRYDLGGLPFGVSASPASSGDTAGEPFAIVAKQVLWVHGLLGTKQPDVAALLRDQCAGAAGVADFRVEVAGSIWDWLGTHLSLGLVRLKTVTIRGRALRA